MYRKLLIKAAVLGCALLSAPAFAGTYNLGPLDPYNYDSATTSSVKTPKTVAHSSNAFKDDFSFSVTGPSIIFTSVEISGSKALLPTNTTWSLYSGAVGGHDTLLETSMLTTTLGGIQASLAPYTGAAGNYFVEIAGTTHGQLAIGGTVALSPSAVPELSTWAMMGIGFASLAFAGSRKRKKAVAVA